MGAAQVPHGGIAASPANLDHGLVITVKLKHLALGRVIALLLLPLVLLSFNSFGKASKSCCKVFEETFERPLKGPLVVFSLCAALNRAVKTLLKCLLNAV